MEEAKAAEAVQKKKPTASYDPFDDMMGGESSEEGDLMDFDFSAPAKKKTEDPKPSVQEPKQVEKPVESAPTREDLTSHRIDKLMAALDTHLCRLSSKVKQSLTIHLCLIVLAFQLGKFYILKHLLSKDDLLSVLTIDTDKIAQFQADCKELKMRIYTARKMRSEGQHTEADKLQKELDMELRAMQTAVQVLYGKLHFQNLKMHIQKIKRTIEKKIKMLETYKSM